MKLARRKSLKTSTLFLVVTLLLCASLCAAQTVSTLSRIDTVNGNTSYTFGVTDLKSGIELWTLGQPDFPDNEVGKTWAIKSLSNSTTQVYFSFYGVVWPKAEPKEQYFALPWPSVVSKVGSATIKTDAYVYLPLNGGPVCWGTYDTGAIWPVAKNIQLGFSGTIWKAEGYRAVQGIGPCSTITINPRVSVDIRYIPERWGDEQFKLQIKAAF